MFCMKSLEVLHLRDVLFDKLFGHENYSAALSDLPGLTSAAWPYEMKCKIQGFVGTSSFSDGCQSSLSIYPMLFGSQSPDETRGQKVMFLSMFHDTWDGEGGGILLPSFIRRDCWVCLLHHVPWEDLKASQDQYYWGLMATCLSAITSCCCL